MQTATNPAAQPTPPAPVVCPSCQNSTEPVISECRDGNADRMLARDACDTCEGRGEVEVAS